MLVKESTLLFAKAMISGATTKNYRNNMRLWKLILNALSVRILYNAFQNRAMYIDGAFLTIVMDADLSLQRIQPTSEYMDCNLTVTGNHTLTVNSYDQDLKHGWKDDPKETPMAVKAGNMVFENTTVNAKGIWYSLFAFGDLQI